MRRLLFTLPAAALALAVTIPAASGHHVTAKTYTVKTGDNFFSPTKRTIHRYDIVKWVWVGEDRKPGATINEHTIAESKDRFQSKTKLKGTFSYRFKKPGKFTVFCAEHPDEMKLTVRVTE
jgi:plastocyanin